MCGLFATCLANMPCTDPSSFPLAPGGAEEERRRLREEAARHTYNQMAPPMAAYRSEVAIASVETTIASSGQGGGAAAAPSAAGLAEKRALIAKTAAELDEEARRKAEQVGVGCGARCRAAATEHGPLPSTKCPPEVAKSCTGCAAS